MMQNLSMNMDPAESTHSHTQVKTEFYTDETTGHKMKKVTKTHRHEGEASVKVVDVTEWMHDHAKPEKPEEAVVHMPGARLTLLENLFGFQGRDHPQEAEASFQRLIDSTKRNRGTGDLVYIQEDKIL
jgi:hypothetical protein